MKKLLSLILCVLMIATALPVGIVYASEEEKSDTELLIACIDALGEAQFTDSFHTNLIAAERMYDELSSAEKTEVTNYSVLQDARVSYNAMAGDNIDTSAYTPYAKGTSDTVSWVLFTNGLLEITGEGTAVCDLSTSLCSQVNTLLIRKTIDNVPSGLFANLQNLQVLTVPFTGTALNATQEDAHLGRIFNTSEYSAYSYQCRKDVTTTSGTTFWHHVCIDHRIFDRYGNLYDAAHSDSYQTRYQSACNDVHYDFFAKYRDKRSATPGEFSPYIVGNKNSTGWYTEGAAGSGRTGKFTYDFQIPSSLRYVNITNASKVQFAAFNGCRYLKTINLSDSVSSIEGYAFAGCTSLEKIVIPSTVTNIEDYSFDNCISLNSINLPNGVQTISGSAFNKCSNLSYVVIPQSITEIGETAFANSALTDVWYHGGIANRADISINADNATLIDATWHYDTCVDKHTYSASCDELCNDCEWIRDAEAHTYDNNCDGRCNVCNNKRTPSDHVYDHACDAFCNECGFERKPAAHVEVVDKGTDATCLKSGLTDGSHCSVCNAVVLAQEVISPKGHTVDTYWTTIESPTCTETGTKVKYCSRCYKIVETADIEVSAHTAVTDKAVPPTCTSTGLTEGSHCSVCSAVLIPQEVVPFAEHTPADEWTITKSATCTEEGAKVRYCVDCNKIAQTAAIEVLPHTVAKIYGKAATCYSTGLTEGSYCSVCDTVLVPQEVIPIAEHTPTDTWTVTEESTCSAHGTKVKTCIYCNLIMQTADADLKPHTIVTDYGKAATCIYTGLTNGSHCSVCNTVLVAQEVIPAKGHSTSVIWTITEPPTCTEEGMKVRYCTVCDKTVAKVIMDKVSHTVVTDKAVAATCTDTGLTEGSHCSVCNAVLVAQEVIPGKGHNPSIVWTFTEMPTCIKEGTKVRCCTDCDKALEKVVMDKTSHNSVTDKAVAATCTDTGLTEGSHCSVCNAVLVAQEVIPAKGHNPSIVWTFTEMPTCIKEGTKVRCCTDCNAIIETARVDTISHVEETVPAVKATCLTTGLTEGSRCSVCDTVIIAQETVGLAPHDYCYKEVHIEGTDKKYTLGNCSVCGVSILRNCDGIESLTIPEEVTAMADYAIIDGEDLCEVIIGRNVTSMGTNSVGYTATTDEATNEILYIKTDNFVIKGYKNTVAEKYAETNGFEFVPIEDDLGLLGDVNLDGVLNIRDATAIQKHLASLVALDESALTVADFNQDSKINIKDATAIQKRLAGLI